MAASDLNLMLSKNQSDPFRNFNNKYGHAVLLWRESKVNGRGVILDKRMSDIDPSTFPLCRRGYNYKHRRNYEGMYPFISTGDFLWYESMEELRCLVLLEHTEEIDSIATQPFCLSFKDNTRHYPDAFAVHADGTRTVYDVKSLDSIDDAVRKTFAKTTDACSVQGWRHVVLHGIAGLEWKNLEWLACFRAEDMHPAPGHEEVLLNYLVTPRTLAHSATQLDAEHPAFHMPAIYHLMFRQGICYDHRRPLTLDTKLWVGGDRAATCHRTQ
ncbi:hypothetical protein QFZ40_001621 [Arthrobacter pascens]|uniref:TnsA-like heteromeric transposase endonuclease subunit n=1 Tax=Arthrobacter pascens TaxID=1677 RepID=UPI002787C597|nr:TnsA-like heteromeric transposase endonuclease subunit [Arthrobacter pascens]MDQ0633712.1 hypothetical protein [Arthrobacter pascens]